MERSTVTRRLLSSLSTSSQPTASERIAVVMQRVAKPMHQIETPRSCRPLASSGLRVREPNTRAT